MLALGDDLFSIVFRVNVTRVWDVVYHTSRISAGAYESSTECAIGGGHGWDVQMYLSASDSCFPVRHRWFSQTAPETNELGIVVRSAQDRGLPSFPHRGLDQALDSITEARGR